MTEQRHKDARWIIQYNADGNLTWAEVQTAVLMDIRDELKRLNAAIWCPNFQAIPTTLRRISRHVAKPRRKPKPRRPR